MLKNYGMQMEQEFQILKSKRFKEVQAHRKILGGNQTNFFGNGIVPIEMFEKNMFQICRMMRCNHS